MKNLVTPIVIGMICCMVFCMTDKEREENRVNTYASARIEQLK